MAQAACHGSHHLWRIGRDRLGRGGYHPAVSSTRPNSGDVFRLAVIVGGLFDELTTETHLRLFRLVQRIGIESTGTYGAGLLRFLQQAGVEILEVTVPDRQDRRKRGKNDDFDAQNAAHAAFAGKRTVTPKSRDGMIESQRVLKACRKTAVGARRIACR